MASLFDEKIEGSTENVTEKENILDYVELKYMAGNGTQMLEGYALDNNGTWHNGYWINSVTWTNSNPDYFLSRWALRENEVEKTAEGKLQDYIVAN